MQTNLNMSAARPGSVGVRLIGAGLAAVVLTVVVGCSSGTETGTAPSAAPAPEAFGPAGYRGLVPGMAKEAALASGKLAPAPTSTLDGCTDFSYTGGPAPDPARMAAEDAAEKKAKELRQKSEDSAGAGQVRQGASAREYADSAAKLAGSAKLAADAALASADVAGKREARDKAFAAAGGASFGKDGLRELGAPQDAKTAEGIGAGSSLEELKKAYEPRGLKLGENKRYQLPIAEKPGWSYEFTTTPDGKVGAVSLISSAKCG
ncbi:hypothetical protein [Amycolatopsis samaneae]|uniref:Lipoprotein n=1 Tax=Amycolatopsis samaneae TaxID=664691 RepID=A0ABW5GNY8_9PSEU